MAKRARAAGKVKPRNAPGASSRVDDTEDVVDRICNTLATAISGGGLKPGSKIMDDVVAEHFGVSRTVVRGALDILQRDRLVERKRNRGAFVAEPTVTEAKQLFEARYALERDILALVIERADPEGLDRLEQLNEEEAHLPDNSDDASTRHGQAPQFHIELAKLGKNDVLTEMLSKVLARVALVNELYKVQPRDNCGDHRNILAAIRNRDLDSARKLMDEHLADLEGRVRLTPTHGDLDSFVNVLKSYSAN